MKTRASHIRQISMGAALTALVPMFLLSGNGDLIEPDDGIVAIGSGGPFALSAAKALAHNTDLDARAIAEKAMAIAGEICIYTNQQIVIEEL